MLCHVAAVKSLPALIYSAVYIFLLVLWDHGVYSENSEIMIMRLDLFSKQIWYSLVFFDLYQVFEKTAILNLQNYSFFLWLLLPDLKGHWWGLNSQPRFGPTSFLRMFSLLLKDLNFYHYLIIVRLICSSSFIHIFVFTYPFDRRLLSDND